MAPKKRDWFFTIIKFIKWKGETEERLDLGWWTQGEKTSIKSPNGWRCQKATTLCFTSIKSPINKTSFFKPFYRRANKSPARFSSTSSGRTLRRCSADLRAKVLIAIQSPHQRSDLLLCAKQISTETHSSCARFTFFLLLYTGTRGLHAIRDSAISLKCFFTPRQDSDETLKLICCGTRW